MKLSLLALAVVAITANAANVYKRDSQDLVLSNTGETCSVSDDGELSCVEEAKQGVDAFSASAVGVGSVTHGVTQTPPEGSISPEEAIAKAANGSMRRSLDMELEGRDSPALTQLDKRWFLFGCGTLARNKCAAKCAYKGFCKSKCSWWGISCDCSCPSWYFPEPWCRPTCWASQCKPRYPPGWGGGCNGGCGGGYDK